MDKLFAESDKAAVVLIDGLLETWDRRFDAEDARPVFVLVRFRRAGGKQLAGA